MTVELPSEKTRGPAGDVHVLADQVTVDPLHEVVGIEVDIFDVPVELGGNVVTEPLGVHAEFEIAQRVDTRAAALAHLLAADGDEAVHVDVVRTLRPEKCSIAGQNSVWW